MRSLLSPWLGGVLWQCGAACRFCWFAARPSCPLWCSGGALRRWCPWQVRLVSCRWWWFVVVPCLPALCPSVLCLCEVLRCCALRFLSLCCLCLLALACFKNHYKTQFFRKKVLLVFSCFPSLLKKKIYTQPNPRPSSKTMYAPQLTCCRPLAMVCSCCWRRCRVVVAGLVCGLS